MIAILKYLWTLRFYLLTHYDQRCVNTKFHLQFFFFFFGQFTLSNSIFSRDDYEKSFQESASYLFVATLSN